MGCGGLASQQDWGLRVLLLCSCRGRCVEREEGEKEEREECRALHLGRCVGVYSQYEYTFQNDIANVLSMCVTLFLMSPHIGHV